MPQRPKINWFSLLLLLLAAALAAICVDSIVRADGQQAQQHTETSN